MPLQSKKILVMETFWEHLEKNSCPHEMAFLVLPDLWTFVLLLTNEEFKKLWINGGFVFLRGKTFSEKNISLDWFIKVHNESYNLQLKK